MNKLAFNQYSSMSIMGYEHPKYLPRENYFSERPVFVLPVIIRNTTPSTKSSFAVTDIDTKTDVLNNFIAKLVEGSKDLEPRLYDFIEENFWDLI